MNSSLMKYLSLAALLFCLAHATEGQISHGGRPLFAPVSSAEEAGLKLVKMPQLPQSAYSNITYEPKDKAQPLRFAHPFFVEYTPENSGSWHRADDGSRIWRIAIKSPGAYSLNLIFDRFVLPRGASLFIYNPEQSVVLGSFTEANNLPSGLLATSPVSGEELIVELRLAAGLRQEPELKIGAINHDYLNVLKYLPIEGSRFGLSGACHPEMSCESDEMRIANGQAVCRIIIDGTELCSGTMVNNSRNDGRPYFMTASHCLKNEFSHNTVIFTFNYQVPDCDSNIEGSFLETISGSELRAKAGELDLALVEMSSMPPAAYRPYWAGWSRSTTPAAPVYTIHHPQGDVKKISVSNNTVTPSSFYSFTSDSHWHVDRWHEGATESGSSGAGLFDANNRLIGTLSGGSASCTNPVNDYFMRFNKAWSYFSAANKQLAIWLSPDDQSLQAVDGFDYYNSSTLDTAAYSGEFKLLPNPASGLIEIYIPNVSGEGRVSLYSISGHKAGHVQLSFVNGKAVMNLSAFMPGFYLLKAEIGGRQYVEKIVIKTEL
jgi:hypothetical protein